MLHMNATLEAYQSVKNIKSSLFVCGGCHIRKAIILRMCLLANIIGSDSQNYNVLEKWIDSSKIILIYNIL